MVSMAGVEVLRICKNAVRNYRKLNPDVLLTVELLGENYLFTMCKIGNSGSTVSRQMVVTPITLTMLNDDVETVLLVLFSSMLDTINAAIGYDGEIQKWRDLG